MVTNVDTSPMLPNSRLADGAISITSLLTSTSSSTQLDSTKHQRKKRKLNDPEQNYMSARSNVSLISIEELFKRELNHFPIPSLIFPTPMLEFDFRIEFNLKSELVHARDAKKTAVIIDSGIWSGTFGHGSVSSGGYDLDHPWDPRPICITEGGFVLQTAETIPAMYETANYFDIHRRGTLSGPRAILDILLCPNSTKNIDPRQYNFCMFCTAKTADNRYVEVLNSGIWVARGVWKNRALIIDAFRVM
ncbi:hypothetical protein NQ176_g1027 [Zarea fungicola]|uniref:Uncharacterized protein n=1 Tax=Zarea fungicola TaxID=93591 RepID=A0ACC1NV93_9HYPO|nr:hypothetical protein NQ176_g1027 [Lecanicillium fungicola]